PGWLQARHSCDANRRMPSSSASCRCRQPSRKPCIPPASEDAYIAEAEAEQRVCDETAVMTVTARAVNDDRLVVGRLQRGGQTPIVLREVVSREVERSRDVPIFEKH